MVAASFEISPVLRVLGLKNSKRLKNIDPGDPDLYPFGLRGKSELISAGKTMTRNSMLLVTCMLTVSGILGVLVAHSL